VPPYRDVAAYDDRAGHYDRGWRGRLHHTIGDRTAALATSTAASPQRVLDVGCGSGYLLRALAHNYPAAEELAGIDAAPNMIETARRRTDDPRLIETARRRTDDPRLIETARRRTDDPRLIETARRRTDDERLTFAVGVAEHLPYPDASIDLVVSSTSFDHWSDQFAGLAECNRVLRPGGQLVLVDQFSRWLLPTLAVSRRGKARTRRRADRLLLRAGFDHPRWHRLYALIINAVVATRRS
jgi:ubiquinone/menaquinone biosynthesis C-methylase UbiE